MSAACESLPGGASRKRSRSGEDDFLSPLSTALSEPCLPPLPKRPSASPPLSSTPSPHLAFLEELCEYEPSPELLRSEVSSSEEEDLVAEMMRTLEKVIGDSGQAPSCSAASDSVSLPVQDGVRPDLEGGPRQGLESRPAGSPNAVADLRHLFEASDDELGLLSLSSPTSAAPSSPAHAWALFDDGEDFRGVHAGPVSHAFLESWLDGESVHAATFYSRDHYGDLVALDGHM